MKTEKRQGAKAPGQPEARLSARVSKDAYQRLFVHALMTGQTMSEILDRLIVAGCREYSLPGKITHRANSPVPVIDSAASPALSDAA